MSLTTSSTAPKEMCMEEANVWRTCVMRHLKHPFIMEIQCNPAADAFEQCVEEWRRHEANATIQVKGKRAGDPPPQCKGLSCAIAHCMEQHTYESSKCSIAMKYFKRCVQLVYLKEYVD